MLMIKKIFSFFNTLKKQPNEEIIIAKPEVKSEVKSEEEFIFPYKPMIYKSHLNLPIDVFDSKNYNITAYFKGIRFICYYDIESKSIKNNLNLNLSLFKILLRDIKTIFRANNKLILDGNLCIQDHSDLSNGELLNMTKNNDKVMYYIYDIIDNELNFTCRQSILDVTYNSLKKDLDRIIFPCYKEAIGYFEYSSYNNRHFNIIKSQGTLCVHNKQKYLQNEKSDRYFLYDNTEMKNFIIKHIRIDDFNNIYIKYVNDTICPAFAEKNKKQYELILKSNRFLSIIFRERMLDILNKKLTLSYCTLKENGDLVNPQFIKIKGLDIIYT